VSGTLRVLVCDDQVVVRTGYATILSAQADMEVIGEAGDGREAVAMAMALQPDVVVMDIRMPGLDGIDATRRLAGPGSTSAAKVLIITSFNLEEYVYESLRAGASGFVLKDATSAELVNAVRTVAAGEALLSPAVTRQLIGRFGERLKPGSSATQQDRDLASLSQREREVLRLMATGLNNAEIAAELVIGNETVRTYVSRLLAKLGLRDRVQAVVFAYQHGLGA